VSRISSDDIAGKLREIQDEVDTTTEAAMPAAFSIGAAVVAGAVGLAYVVGQRKARKQTTVVEVRRV
jgi:hypothetical protein